MNAPSSPRSMHPALSNAFWLVAERLLRMTLALFVGTWVARYLAPEAFGSLNYAYAFVSLFSPLATLGLESIVVRELVRRPEHSGQILASAWALRCLGALVCCLAIGVVALVRPRDGTTQVLILILLPSLLLQTSDVADLWFQAKTRSVHVVLARLFAAFSVAGVRVVLVVNEAPLYAFAWVVSVEALATGAAVGVVFIRRAQVQGALRCSLAEMRSLWVATRPLVASGLLVALYMRIDQVMLGEMVGDVQVGLYSAATRVAEIWYFLPGAVVASVFPTLTRVAQSDRHLYLAHLQALYGGLTWLGIAVGAALTLLAPWLVHLLYGADYAPAASILAISAWSGLFVAQGVARGQWMILENLQRFTLWYIGGAAVINILLNALLIPRYGAFGAAAATLAAQLSATVLIPACFAETRVSAWMLLRAFHPQSLRSGIALLGANLRRP